MQARSFALWFVFVSATIDMAAGAPQARWQTTLESAKRLAAQNNQLVLIHFWAPYCTACRRMDQEVFPDPTVVATLQNYYVPVKINTEYFPATAKQYSITSLPTDLIITPQGQVVGKFEGMVKASEYAARLGQVAASGHAQAPAVYAQIPQGQPAQPPVNAYAPAGAAGNMYAAPGVAADASATAPANAAPVQHPAYAQAPVAAIANPSTAAVPAYGGPTAPGFAAPQGTPFPQAPVQQQALPATSGLPAANGVAANINPYAGMAPGAPTMTPSAPTLPPNAPAMTPPPAAAAASGGPQLGLEGFCPVQLVEAQKWVPGDRRWGVIHQGRVYLISGPNEQARFYANPDAYAPVLSGNDAVVAAESGQMVPGLRQYGVYYGNHVYLFSSEQSLVKFERAPDRYAIKGPAQPGLRPASYAPGR